MEKLVETELHEEGVELPEKRKRTRVSNKQSSKQPKWKMVWQEAAELIVPWAVVIVGVTSLVHSCQVSTEANGYREQLSYFEARRRLTDLVTTFQTIQYNEALSGRIIMDSNGRNAMLAEINSVGDELYRVIPNAKHAQSSDNLGLSVAQMLLIGNLNSDSYWKNRAETWYDRAYDIAMDYSNDASSYTERTAMIYHHIRPFQVDGKYGDTKALQAGIDGLRKSLDGAGDDFTSKLSKYYIYQWLASALNSHGYITSCKLNITGFKQWLASNPSLQSLHAQEMQKRGDFTLCNNTWRDQADQGQYTF